jgi:hypothetical protein
LVSSRRGGTVRTKQTGAGAISTSIPRDGLVEPRPFPNTPAPPQNARQEPPADLRTNRPDERWS